MSTATILDIALAAAQTCTVSIAAQGATWSFTAEIALHAGLLTISVPVNAVLDDAASRALGAATRAAVRGAFIAAGYTTRSVKWTTAKGTSAWHADGYWMHGSFHTSKRYCQMRPVAAQAAA